MVAWSPCSSERQFRCSSESLGHCNPTWSLQARTVPETGPYMTNAACEVSVAAQGHRSGLTSSLARSWFSPRWSHPTYPHSLIIRAHPHFSLPSLAGFSWHLCSQCDPVPSLRALSWALSFQGHWVLIGWGSLDTWGLPWGWGWCIGKDPSHWELTTCEFWLKICYGSPVHHGQGTRSL